MFARRASPVPLSLLLSLSLACSEGSETVSSADAGSSDVTSQPLADALAPSTSAVVGAFIVKLNAPVAATATTAAVEGFTEVSGLVKDGPEPSLWVWKQAAADGSCVLLTPRVPVCAKDCGGNAACVEDDTCMVYPTAKSAGTVKVSGVHSSAGSVDVTLEAISNSYGLPAEVRLPHPAFAEGEEITLSASGGDLAPFLLSAKGIAPLELTTTSLALQDGQAATIAWKAAGQAGISRIRVKLDISHHGGTKGKIECEAGDSGSLTIAASLVSQLLKLGVAGFPTVVVERVATAEAALAVGRVVLEVSSAVEREVRIPGLASCSNNSDCPTGKVCQSDLSCSK